MARLLGLDVEEKLMRNHIKDEATGCWRWQGCHSGRDKAYGMIWLPAPGARGGMVQAHRLAHRLWVGPIPEGHTVDHVHSRGCRYKDCINPAHLEAVTVAENNRRSPGTISTVMAAKTHCKHGHEFTPENTYLVREQRRGGGVTRKCKTCYRKNKW